MAVTLVPMGPPSRAPGALVVVVALVFGVASLATPAPVRAAWSTAAYSTADEDLMLQLMNSARATAGLRPLVMDSRLRGVAESRSSDFVAQKYFGHNIPTACGQVFSILQQQGIAYAWAAENIGWNTYSDDQATQWQFDWFMNSAGHKANILSSLATSVGIGAYKNAWTYGSACGQTGTGATYAAAKLYAIVFIQDPPADTTPPTVTAPVSKLYTSTAGTTTIPVSTSWTRTDASGISSSTLERQVNGGTFSGVSLSSGLATSVAQSLGDGASYRYRVSATDLAGNTCPSVNGASIRPSRVEQSSTAVAFGGTWTTASSTSASGGSFKYSSAAGASASYTASARSLGWVARKSTSGGSAYVYVDGVLKATISLYATATADRPIVYVVNWSSQGTHTLKIVVKGTGRVYLDAFVKLANA